MKEKTFPWMPQSERLQRFMKSCAGILLINWVMQGMRGMDSKELAFRLLLEGLLTLLFWTAMPLALAWVVAHTLNWVFNGHIWVCARYCPWYSNDLDRMKEFTSNVWSDLMSARWIREAVFIGSVGEEGTLPSERSDIDLRLMIPPGWEGWLAANLMLLKLRANAFLLKMPLDLYAYNDIHSLDQFRPDEKMLVVKDLDGRLEARYPDRVRH